MSATTIWSTDLKIALMNPAPRGQTQRKWGDYHFGLSLQKALEARGAEVRQYFWPEWESDDVSDAVIVLRGKRRFLPAKDGRPWLLWIISHPAAVTLEELDAYTVGCPGSSTLYKEFIGATKTPLKVLRQCTDTSIFSKSSDTAARRKGLLFVANSRGVQREMVRWGARTGLRPDLFGDGWRPFGMQDLVVGSYVDNHHLPELYRSYKLGLNDHWGDMRHFGLINNRIFDCLASGLPVVSDWFPELESVLGDGVLYARCEREYWERLWWARSNYSKLLGRTKKVWDRLSCSYSFQARADELLEILSSPPKRAVVSKPREGSLAYERRALEGVLRRVSEAGGRLLHVQPTPELTSHLTAVDGVEWLGAGFGPGPWEVALDSHASQLGRHFYDILVLDWTPAEAPLALEAAQRMVKGLLRAIKPSGVVIVPVIQGNEHVGSTAWRAALDTVGSMKKSCYSDDVCFLYQFSMRDRPSQDE